MDTSTRTRTTRSDARSGHAHVPVHSLPHEALEAPSIRMAPFVFFGAGALRRR